MVAPLSQSKRDLQGAPHEVARRVDAAEWAAFIFIVVRELADSNLGEAPHRTFSTPARLLETVAPQFNSPARTTSSLWDREVSSTVWSPAGRPTFSSWAELEAIPSTSASLVPLNSTGIFQPSIKSTRRPGHSRALSARLIRGACRAARCW